MFQGLLQRHVKSTRYSSRQTSKAKIWKGNLRWPPPKYGASPKLEQETRRKQSGRPRDEHALPHLNQALYPSIHRQPARNPSKNEQSYHHTLAGTEITTRASTYPSRDLAFTSFHRTQIPTEYFRFHKSKQPTHPLITNPPERKARIRHPDPRRTLKAPPPSPTKTRAKSQMKGTTHRRHEKYIGKG